MAVYGKEVDTGGRIEFVVTLAGITRSLLTPHACPEVSMGSWNSKGSTGGGGGEERCSMAECKVDDEHCL